MGYAHNAAGTVLALTGGEQSRRAVALDDGLSTNFLDQVLGRVAATAFKFLAILGVIVLVVVVAHLLGKGLGGRV